MYPEKKVIQIKPLPLDKWHGKKGKEDFARPKIVSALFDPKSGRYATGLTDKERKILEKELGIDLSDVFSPTKPHPFWDESKAGKLELPNHTIFLKLDNPYDYIKYKIAQQSKFVANSFKEWKEGLYPDATHYIVDEESEVTYKISEVEAKKKAYKLLDQLTPKQKKHILTILTGKETKNVSNEYVEVKLSEFIENDPEKFTVYASMDKKDIELRALIAEAVSQNVVKVKDNVYKYGDVILGIGIDEAIDYLKREENQQLYLILKDKIK